MNTSHEIERMASERWLRSLTEAYKFWKGERANQLKGKYVSRRDGRGIDPASEAWGNVLAFESMHRALGGLRDEIGLTPQTLRALAQLDAERDYAEQVIKEART